MTGIIACMLEGLGQGHGAWSCHSLSPRPVDVIDTVVHPSSSWLPCAFVLPILPSILPLTSSP